MRVQKSHAHAYTEYNLVGWRHYIKLILSVIDYKRNGWDSLTVHLPFEIQHPNYCGPKKNGFKFIYFGEKLKKMFRVNLYWENAPWLNIGVWDLKHKNILWSWVPDDIDLTLDTGHLILGSKNKKEARARIRKMLEEMGWQIKHLHLHENDLIHDQHDIRSKSILTKSLIKQLTKGRTFIWEGSE